MFSTFLPYHFFWFVLSCPYILLNQIFSLPFFLYDFYLLISLANIPCCFVSYILLLFLNLLPSHFSGYCSSIAVHVATFYFLIFFISPFASNFSFSSSFFPYLDSCFQEVFKHIEVRTAFSHSGVLICCPKNYVGVNFSLLLIQVRVKANPYSFRLLLCIFNSGAVMPQSVYEKKCQ